jgi:hypothetical protein
MTKKAVLLIVLFLAIFACPATHAEETGKKWGLGAEFGLFWYQNGDAYQGKAPDVIHELGGSTDGSILANWAMVPILTQAWYPIKLLQLELKERWWMMVVKGRFEWMPDLNYRLEKDVWPITLSLKVTGATSNNRFGGFFGVGPGMYIVQTREAGYFGNYNGVEVQAGVHVNGGIFVGIVPQCLIKLDVSYDWFRINRVNNLLQDGGDAGGYTLALGFEYLL